MASASVPPGWYPDPDGRPCEKYWDGSNWGKVTRPLSTISGKPAPKESKVGLDSNEKLILAFIAFAFLAIIFFYPY